MMRRQVGKSGDDVALRLERPFQALRRPIQPPSSPRQHAQFGQRDRTAPRIFGCGRMMCGQPLAFVQRAEQTRFTGRRRIDAILPRKQADRNIRTGDGQFIAVVGHVGIPGGEFFQDLHGPQAAGSSRRVARGRRPDLGQPMVEPQQESAIRLVGVFPRQRIQHRDGRSAVLAALVVMRTRARGLFQRAGVAVAPTVHHSQTLACQKTQRAGKLVPVIVAGFAVRIRGVENLQRVPVGLVSPSKLEPRRPHVADLVVNASQFRRDGDGRVRSRLQRREFRRGPQVLLFGLCQLGSVAGGCRRLADSPTRRR
jgi:hypothetical protein